MQHILRAISGPQAGAVYVLGRRTSIGRASDCDIQIVHEGVSRHHAKLTQDAEGNMVLVDLASDNGTFVDDQRITRHVLQPGEAIRIMRSRFTYEHLERGDVVTSAVFHAKRTSGESLRQTADHRQSIAAMRASIVAGTPSAVEAERTRTEQPGTPGPPAVTGRPGTVVPPHAGQQAAAQPRPIALDEDDEDDEDEPETVRNRKVPRAPAPDPEAHASPDEDEPETVRRRRSGSASAVPAAPQPEAFASESDADAATASESTWGYGQMTHAELQRKIAQQRAAAEPSPMPAGLEPTASLGWHADASRRREQVTRVPSKLPSAVGAARGGRGSVIPESVRAQAQAPGPEAMPDRPAVVSHPPSSTGSGTWVRGRPPLPTPTPGGMRPASAWTGSRPSPSPAEGGTSAALTQTDPTAPLERGKGITAEYGAVGGTDASPGSQDPELASSVAASAPPSPASDASLWETEAAPRRSRPQVRPTKAFAFEEPAGRSGPEVVAPTQAGTQAPAEAHERDGGLDAMKTVPAVRRASGDARAAPVAAEGVPHQGEADDDVYGRTQPRIIGAPAAPPSASSEVDAPVRARRHASSDRVTAAREGPSEVALDEPGEPDPGLLVLTEILEYRHLRLRSLQGQALSPAEGERYAVLERRLHQRPATGDEVAAMRRYHRFPCTMPARLRRQGEGDTITVPGVVADLSASGAKLAIDEPTISAGETVWLSLDLAGADLQRVPYTDACAVVFKARVVWVRASRLGLSFAGAPRYERDPVDPNGG